ncbi:MAG TPA: ScyD/ScyE family protein [Candidatus Dormibacteraeota bacterium]
MQWYRRAVMLAGVAGVAGSVMLSGGAAAAQGTTWSFSPVAFGLSNPRGIAFDGLGGMYVAESGLPGTAPLGVTQSGAVDKYTLSGSGATRVWSTHFNSLFDNGERGSDALGPAGMSAVGNGCTKASAGQREGCQVLVIMSESQQGVIAQGGPPIDQIGHLFRLDSVSGAATDRGDIGDQEYAWTNANKGLWQEFPDSNPYGVLVTGGGAAASHTFVIDAGANTVSEVLPDGTIRVIAYIPNEVPMGNLPTRDATPTCAAEGPDGALYVGTLDLIRNFATAPTQGMSNVWRIDPNSHENFLTAAHLWATGLTTVTACSFDSAGNFWAAEMFKLNQAGPPGDLVRIPFTNPTQLEHIGGGHLLLPGGVAQGPDGAIYVTVGSAANKPFGAVVRVSQQ